MSVTRAPLAPPCALLDEMDLEARAGGCPVDLAAYEAAGRDPAGAIAFAGAPAARVCVLGRELGRDEVRHAQPLVGLSGRRVRRGVLEAQGLPGEPTREDPLLERALAHVFLANTVPFKPPGNRPFSAAVVERFRPLVARLLVAHWQGDTVIALGDEAFRWIARAVEAPAAGSAAASSVAPVAPAASAASAAESSSWAARAWSELCEEGAGIRCRLTATCHGIAHERVVTAYPLPHPSPLNVRWSRQFPALLARCLARGR